MAYESSRGTNHKLSPGAISVKGYTSGEESSKPYHVYYTMPGTPRGETSSSNGGGGSYGARKSEGQNGAEIYAAYLAQKRAAAQQAHERGTQRLNDAYNTLTGRLGENLNSTLGDLSRRHAAGAQSVNRSADDAQQQAYVNYMLSRRDMPQALTAQGITGGASESTLADMYNGYGNSRNKIDTQRGESLTQLENTLLDNQGAAQRLYNEQLSAAEQQKLGYQQQLDAALLNLEMDILDSAFSQLQNVDSGYLAQLTDLLQNQASATDAATAVPYTASNTPAAVTTQQAQAEGLDQRVISRIVKMMNEEKASVPDVILYLTGQGLTEAQTGDYLRSLGVDVG